jgi:hypothetical protein
MAYELKAIVAEKVFERAPYGRYAHGKVNLIFLMIDRHFFSALLIAFRRCSDVARYTDIKTAQPFVSKSKQTLSDLCFGKGGRHSICQGPLPADCRSG